MKTIGIFEAKTTFSTLCETVADQREPVLVQKRGQPLVVISPVRDADLPDREDDILSAWRHWNSAHPDETDSAHDFPEVWKERHNREHSPLEDEDEVKDAG